MLSKMYIFRRRYLLNKKDRLKETMDNEFHLSINRSKIKTDLKKII